MNKFDMVEVTQRLSQCNRNLDKSLQILSKSTVDAEEAFNNLSDALEKIKLANDYIKPELREVI